jgi:hypothetical protein
VEKKPTTKTIISPNVSVLRIIQTPEISTQKEKVNPDQNKTIPQNAELPKKTTIPQSKKETQQNDKTILMAPGIAILHF